MNTRLALTLLVAIVTAVPASGVANVPGGKQRSRQPYNLRRVSPAPPPVALDRPDILPTLRLAWKFDAAIAALPTPLGQLNSSTAGQFCRIAHNTAVGKAFANCGPIARIALDIGIAGSRLKLRGKGVGID